MEDLYLAVLAGGKGTRLWPISNNNLPKQFISLDGKHSLFQKTLSRLDGLSHNQILTLTNANYFNLASKQSEQIKFATKLLIEPEIKNTAPSILAAALTCRQNYTDDPILAVFPSDHEINNNLELQRIIKKSYNLAKQGYFVAIGINPTRPDSGYGYIQKGNNLAEGVFKALRFVEKPHIDLATYLVQNGSYLWNLGIYILPVNKLLHEMEVLDRHNFCLIQDSLKTAEITENKIFLNQSFYQQVQSISIDYKIMENTRDLAVIEADLEWRDLGTWRNLWESGNKDENGNILGEKVIALNTKNSFVNSYNGRTIAAVGIENTSIVEIGNTLLVLNNNECHNMKQLAEYLNDNKPKDKEKYEYTTWGYFENLEVKNSHIIKKLCIYPNQVVTLPGTIESRRVVVLNGCGEVAIESFVTQLHEDKIFYIPENKQAIIKNNGNENCEMIVMIKPNNF